MSGLSGSFTSQLFTAANNTNRYGSLVVFIFGSIGVILNILIFSIDPDLKQNPCSRLFLASSIASSIVLFAGLPTRFISSFGLDATARNDFLCKSYMFVLLGSFTASALFTSLISVERWLNSCANPRYRNLTSIKNANRAIVMVIIVVVAAFSQIYYCFVANISSTRSPCGANGPACLYFNDIIHLILFVLVPCAIMLLFGTLTLRNIQTSLRRIENVTSTGATKMGRRAKRTQTTMTALMFIQVGLITFCNLPAGIQKVYSNITMNDLRSPERRAIEALSFQWVFLFTYIGIAVPFYLYTLTGTVFRQAIYRRLRAIVPARWVTQEVTETTRPQ